MPASGSLPPAKQSYNNTTQPVNRFPAGSDYSSALGGIIDSTASGMNLLGPSGTYTIDPGGPNQTVIPVAAEAPPSWTRPASILVIKRGRPLNLAFTPGVTASPMGIGLYLYAAATNSTVKSVIRFWCACGSGDRVA